MSISAPPRARVDAFEVRFADAHRRERLLTAYLRDLAEREQQAMQLAAAVNALEQLMDDRRRRLMAQLVFLDRIAVRTRPDCSVAVKEPA